MVLWADKIHRFEGAAGTVAVNGTADRWCVYGCDREALRLAVEDTLFPTWQRPPDEWAALCRAVPTSGRALDVQEWVDALLAAWPGTGLDPARPLRLLGSLRLRGVLLWPVDVHELPHPVDLDRRLLVLVGRTEYEEGLIGCIPQHKTLCRTVLMSCTPVDSVDVVCEPALLAALAVVVESNAGRSGIRVGRAMQIFRCIEGSCRSDGSTVQILDQAHDLLRRQQQLDAHKTSRFGGAATRSAAAPWLAWFELASDVTLIKYGAKQDKAFSDWLEYLAASGAIPPPKTITRETHVLGNAGFLAWLGKRVDTSTEYYANKLIRLQEMFVLIVASGEAPAVPINDDDIPIKPQANNKSNKLVLPRELMEAAREVVRELVSAAFRQFDELGDRVWKPAGKLLPGSPEALALDAQGSSLPETLLNRESFSHLLVTLRSTDGALVRIINPVLPVAYLWLLRLPNRGMEILHLDSGEADEEIPHVETVLDGEGCQRVLVRWLTNPHPLAARGDGKER